MLPELVFKGFFSGGSDSSLYRSLGVIISDSKFWTLFFPISDCLELLSPIESRGLFRNPGDIVS